MMLILMLMYVYDVDVVLLLCRYVGRSVRRNGVDIIYPLMLPLEGIGKSTHRSFWIKISFTSL
jgi:hypothetical protein